MFNHRVSLPPPSSHHLLIFSFTHCRVLFCFINFLSILSNFREATATRVCAAAAMVNFEAHKTMKEKNSNPPTEKKCYHVEALVPPRRISVLPHSQQRYTSDLVWKESDSSLEWRKKYSHTYPPREVSEIDEKKKSLNFIGIMWCVPGATTLRLSQKSLLICAPPSSRR